MDSDRESKVECTLPEIKEAAKITTLNLLLVKSRKKYELIYKQFMDWKKTKNTNLNSENVLLAYFSKILQ